MYPRNLVQAVEAMLEGKGVRATAKQAGISKTTAGRLFSFLRAHVPLCPCGRPSTHQGHCRFRLERDARPSSFISDRHVASVRFRREQSTESARLITRSEALHLARQRRDEDRSKGNNLLEQIEHLIPPELPRHVRDELRQALALRLLSGDPVDLEEERKRAWRATYAQEGSFITSLDAPLDDDRTLASVLPAPEQEPVEDDTFDFDTHCFGCGQRGYLRRLHGHTQCMNCGCITEPCCND